jgi:putative transposase
MNPVRAKLVKRPWDWEWSSAKEHCGEGKSSLSLSDMGQYLEVSKEGWKQILKEENESGVEDLIRKATKNGRGVGSEEFYKKMEKKLEYRIKLLSVGRPRKKETE